MLIDPLRLREALSSDNGRRLEYIWQDLLRCDAAVAKLPINAVDWDDRESVGDGGKDIVVRQGATAGSCLLLPTAPSIWSIKSGNDGLRPNVLRRELTAAGRSRLLDAVKAGHFYCWCTLQPASNNQRDALEKAAKEIASVQGFGEAQIKFFYVDQLADALRRYSGILTTHLPALVDGRGHSVREWAKRNPHLDAAVPWVDFQSRSQTVDDVYNHLVGTSAPGILHIAGLSGIGKSRLVFEAASRAPLNAAVECFASFAKSERAVRFFERDEGTMGKLIIDECSLDEYAQLVSTFDGSHERLRIVTIGPARRRERGRAGVVLVPEPDTLEGVLKVLLGNSRSTLPEPIAQAIAAVSNHDLRLALLIADAVRTDSGLIRDVNAALDSLSDPIQLFHRVLRLFDSTLRGAPGFEVLYPYLSMCHDIGMRDDLREELDFLAREAVRPIADLDAAAHASDRCGLGHLSERYFEAVPRGLATLVFTELLWPRIKNDLAGLVKRMPNDRFRKAFHRRVELCGEELRGEVGREVGAYFRERLGASGTALLADPGLARTFASWVEIAPELGLEWLCAAVDSATVAELQTLPGSTGWMGPSGGRRELVWLCEHLACFAEYFRQCEHILFRLAVAENEPIGNNATNVWKQKFWVFLSGTEVPFADRSTLLLQRLQAATIETLPLIFDGVVGALTTPHSAIAQPPVVGGRVVPPEWRPATKADVISLWSDLIVRALTVIDGYEPTLRVRAVDGLIAEVGRFFKRTTKDQLRALLSPEVLSDDQKSRLVSRLEHKRADLLQEPTARAAESVSFLDSWISSLAPQTIIGQVRHVVARPIWEYNRLKRRQPDRPTWNETYEALVEPLAHNPDVLRELSGWLSSQDAKGARPLGFVIGQSSASEKFRPLFDEWIRTWQCVDMSLGYLDVVRSRQGVLPAWAKAALDDLARARPEDAGTMTSMCDPSEDGLHRIATCLKADRIDRGRVLRSMYGSEWESLLSDADRAWLIDQLWPPGGSRNDQWGAIAFELLGLWRFRKEAEPIAPELASSLLRLVTEPPSSESGQWSSDWVELAEALADTAPEVVASTTAGFLTDLADRRLDLKDAALKVLIAVAAKHPSAVMEAIGERITDPKGRVSFFYNVHRDLFESIGLEVVRKWVEPRGVEAARAIARHLKSPYVDGAGTAVVPPITEWFLHTYGDDEKAFKEFCLGRHSWEMRSGRAWERDAAMRQLQDAFAHHPISGVKKWLAYEIEEHQRDVASDRREEDEWDRS